MKKTYIAPSLMTVITATERLLAGSGVESEQYGIGYGGIDEQGKRDPEARRRTVWDDDSENEDDL